MLDLELLEARHLLTNIVGVAPAGGSYTSPGDGPIAAEFDRPIDSSTVSLDSFVVHTSQTTGPVDGTFAIANDSDSGRVLLQPQTPFAAGERIQVTAAATIEGVDATPTTPFVWQYHVAPRAGTGILVDTGQILGGGQVWDVALGDVDADGDLDAFALLPFQANQLWLNDGHGQFVDSGQELGDARGSAVELVDVDGDGDLDAIVANGDGEPSRVWLNVNGGEFVDSGQALHPRNAVDLAVGDLDGDGDVDAVFTVDGGGHTIWFNDGQGKFSNFGTAFGQERFAFIELVDIDGDGDLDAVLPERYLGNAIWENDGQGGFSQSQVLIGDAYARDIRFGDLDGDGDLDAVLATGPVEIWLNEGESGFVKHATVDETSETHSLELADFDNDFDLDIITATTLPRRYDDARNRLMLNDGDANFIVSPRPSGFGESFRISVGDLDNDGDLDAIFGGRPDDNGNLSLIVLNADADLAVQTDPPTLSLAPGDTTEAEFTVSVSNLGPIALQDASVAGLFVDAVTNLRLSDVLVPDEGASAALVGEIHGPFADTISLAAGGRIEYHFVGTVNAPSPAVPSLRLHQFTASLPPGMIESNPGNNTTATLLTLPTVPPRGTGFFVESGHKLLETNSLDVALADLDGDGDIDAFVATEQANLVHLNYGGGLLLTTYQALGIDRSNQVALGDVDGDGDVDAVVANYEAPNRLWINDGSGFFSSSAQFLGAGKGNSIGLGDLDGDGDLDVVTTNSGTDGAAYANRVWLNDGYGRFAATAQAVGDELSQTVVLADFDGDGDLDLFEGVYDVGGRVWKNDGQAAFSLEQSFVGFRGLDAAAGDLDGDDDIDLFLPNTRDDDMVMLNDGAGMFTAGAQLDADQTYGVAIADVDADGDLDIFTTLSGFEHLVWINNGTAQFTRRSLNAEHATTAVALADLDGDGDVDAFVNTNENPDKIWLNAETDLRTELVTVMSAPTIFPGASLAYSVTITNAGPGDAPDAEIAGVFSGPFAERTLTNLTTTGGATTSLASGDLPHQFRSAANLPVGGTITFSVEARVADGTPSSVAAGDFGGLSIQASLLNGIDIAGGDNGGGSKTKISLAATGGSGLLVDSGDSLGKWNSYGIALGDLDGDGDLDAFVVNQRGDQGHRVRMNMGGVFLETQILEGTSSPVLAMGDVEPDGDLDVLLRDGLFLNDGTGYFERSTLIRKNRARGLNLADFDGDGDLDALLDDFVYMNREQLGFVAEGERIQRSGNYASLGDIDGDGDVDVLYGNLLNGNIGDGTFFEGNRPVGSGTGHLADLDGDGDLDVFSTVYGPNEVWLNDGTGNFFDTGQRLGNDPTRSTDIADLDGDGDLDVFTTGGEHQDVFDHYIWLNDGAGNFTPGSGAIRINGLQQIALGDLDGDGDIDGFLAIVNGPNQVWINPAQEAVVDISVAINDGNSFVRGGDGVAYHVQITNEGDSRVDGIPVHGVLPALFLEPTITQVAVPPGGATSLSPGVIDRFWSDTVSLPPTSTLKVTISGFVAATSGANQRPDDLMAGRIEVEAPAGMVLRPDRIGYHLDVNRVLPAAVGGSGVFEQGPSLPVIGVTEDVDFADIDGDGDLDAVVATDVPDVRVLLNDGQGRFTLENQSFDVQPDVDVVLGDVDGDGDVDLLIADRMEEDRVYVNDGRGAFSLRQQVPLGRPFADAMTLIDVDADGDNDLILGVNLYENDGTGFFAESTNGLLGLSQGPTIKASGDVDGDGDLDLLLDQGLYLNDGRNSFRRFDERLKSNRSGWTVGDLDGDGDLDAVGSSYLSQTVWRNDGPLGFTQQGDIVGITGAEQTELGDVDGDGDLDVAFLVAGGDIRFFLNDGSGAFVNRDFSFATASARQFTLVDLDRDGDLDVYVVNENAPDMIWLNQPAESLVDLSVAIRDNRTTIRQGDSIEYAVVASNNSNANVETATLTIDLPDVVTLAEVVSFSSSGGASSTLSPQVFHADIVDVVSLPPAATVTYLVQVRAPEAHSPNLPAQMRLSTRATLTPPDETRDANPADNVAADSNTLLPAATGGTGLLSELPARGELAPVEAAALGDLDGDGDLDAFLAFGGPDRVALNDGRGNFTVTSQRFNDYRSEVVALGDLDGDGDLDAMIGDRRGSMKLFVNDGAGFFTQADLFFQSSEYANNIELGDLNGDGLLDIVVFNDRSDRVGVFLNQGDLTFTSDRQDIAADEPTGDLGDIDGDGDLDLVFAHDSLTEPRVWLNDGTGSFVALPQDVDGVESQDVALGDFDGDGDLDALFTNHRYDGSRIWLNDGSGKFTRSDAEIDLLTRDQVAVADVDGDGDLDILTPTQANLGASRLLLNDGTGRFTPGPDHMVTHELQAPLAIGDLDGDGDLDAVAPVRYGVVALLNSDVDLAVRLTSAVEAAEPGETIRYVVRTTNNGPAAVVGARVLTTFNTPLDGLLLHGVAASSGASTNVSAGPLQGQLDALVDLPPGGSVLFRLEATLPVDVPISATPPVLTARATISTPEGMFDGIPANSSALQSDVLILRSAPSSGVFVEGPPLIGSDPTHDVALGDVDGDGDIDAVIANSERGNQVWLNDAGVFTETGLVLGERPSHAVALGDLNGDGHLDAVFGNNDQGNEVWLGDGAGRFTNTGQSFDEDEHTTDIAIADLDGDGDLDIYGVNDGRPDAVWLNNGQGVFTEVRDGDPLPSSSHAVALGDLDGDGDLDAFVAAEYFDRPNFVMLNVVGGRFVRSEQDLAAHATYGVALSDIDGDGDLDAFLANGRRQGNRVLLGDGNGNFTDTGQQLGTSDGRGVALADIDGDGDVDAFVVNDGAPDRVWLNDGRGNFTDSGQVLGSDASAAVALADFDGDGNLDAFVAINGGRNRIWSNILVTDLPDVRIEVTSGTVAVVEGSRIEYTITASNTGNRSVQDVVVRDEFPVQMSNVVLASVSAVGQASTSLAPGPLDSLLEDTVDLPVGASIVYFVTGRIAAGRPNTTTLGPTITNTATIALPPGLPPEINPSDNRSTDSDVVVLAAGAGEARFTAIGQSVEQAPFIDASLGDLDGDGDLDLYVVGGRNLSDQVWFNDGKGKFTDSGQRLGVGNAFAAALGDLDGDGDLDVFLARDGWSQVWLNDGSGMFQDSGQELISIDDISVRLSDLDGDGDLDALVLSEFRNKIWLNDGSGRFTDSGQLQLYFRDAVALGLGDLDADGDLDAFIAVSEGPNRVFFNDGLGNFADSGQLLGGALFTGGVAVGDLDGDGDLDAMTVAGSVGGNFVFLNDGTGVFTEFVGAPADQLVAAEVELGDFDADGDLDAFLSGSASGRNRVWLNQGDGRFVASPETLARVPAFPVVVGDLDGDDDLDALTVGLNNRTIVWFNQTSWLPPKRFPVPPIVKLPKPPTEGPAFRRSAETAGSGFAAVDRAFAAWTGPPAIPRSIGRDVSDGDLRAQPLAAFQ